MEKKLQKEIYSNMMDLKEAEVLELSKEVLEKKFSPIKIIELGLSPAMTLIGEKYDKGEGGIFLPHLMIAANIMKGAVKILMADYGQRGDDGTQGSKLPVVVTGVAEGDIHEIGKDIVATMLGTAGFKIIDLGTDVSAENFINTAENNEAKVIAISAMMTTTRSTIKEVVAILTKNNLREKYKVIGGGAAVTEAYITGANADGYAKNAGESVLKVKELLNM